MATSRLLSTGVEYPPTACAIGGGFSGVCQPAMRIGLSTASSRSEVFSVASCQTTARKQPASSTRQATSAAMVRCACAFWNASNQGYSSLGGIRRQQRFPALTAIFAELPVGLSPADALL